MKLLAFSDNHGSLTTANKYKQYIPEGKFDAILCAGDVFPLQFQSNGSSCVDWFKDKFAPDLKNLMEITGAKKVLICPGNHDFAFANEDCLRIMNEVNLDIHILVNDLETIEDEAGHKITVYGSPFFYMRYPWAFSVSKQEEEYQYRNIPKCDILLTHCPPSGLPHGQLVTDTKLLDFGNIGLKKAMDEDLISVDTIVCGHIHEGLHKQVRYRGIRLCNVAVKNEDYKYVNDLTEIDFQDYYFYDRDEGFEW